MNLRLVILCALAAFAPDISYSQGCNGGYERLTRSAMVVSGKEPVQILMRMAALAEQSANGIYSQTQRSALDSEFVALAQEIERIGNVGNPAFGVRGNAFLDSTIDTTFLQISSLRLLGNTIEESQRLSRQAIDATNAAQVVLQQCMGGSWDRIIASGSPNQGNCAGGYDRVDRLRVREALAETKKILNKLERMAQQGASKIDSLGMRQVRQDDFDYLREEIELLSNSLLRIWPTTLRTRQFLQTFIDAMYLGIDQSTLMGRSALEAQINAQRAVQDIIAAKALIDLCR